MIRLDASNALGAAGGKIPDQAMAEGSAALDALVRRKGPGSDMLGWLDLPRTPAAAIKEIEDEGKRIRDESDCLVVVGIGGSYLGARAVIEALPGHSNFPVYFAGNSLSPVYHKRLLSLLEGRRFSLCVISKSGTTTEPAVAFRLLKKRLIEETGDEAARRRITAVTDPARGALRSMAEEEGWRTFAIPRDVGGRFSVLSPVGLLPCAASGIPAGQLVEGAAKGISRFTAADEDNEALMYAVIRKALYDRGAFAEILSIFDPEMLMFCEWWKQLAGESEGKQGKGMLPASAVMTTDLHSLGQLLQDGPRKMLETFLVSSRPASDIEVPRESSASDGLGYLEGTGLSEINRKAFEGTRDAHSAGGLPNLTLELESITPGSIGELIVFFETAIAVSAGLLGVNPFDQPGVEEYKTRMFRLLGRPGSQ